MEERKIKKPIPKRVFQIFGGIAICTLMLILIINTGVVARALSFPFVYMFGIYSYLIFALFYLFGFKLIFKIQIFKVKYISVIIGLIILFICACGFTSIIWNNFSKVGLTIGEYSSYFFKINYFTEKSIINMFSTTQPTNYAGGFFGTLICQPFAKTNTVITYLILSLLLVTGLLFTFFPVTSKALKNRKNNKKNKSHEENDDQMISHQSPIISYDPIKNANSGNFMENINKTPSAEFVRIDQSNSSYNDAQPFTQFEGAGMFKKPHFDLHATPDTNNNNDSIKYKVMDESQERAYPQPDKVEPLTPISAPFSNKEVINQNVSDTQEFNNNNDINIEEFFPEIRIEEVKTNAEPIFEQPVPTPTPVQIRPVQETPQPIVQPVNNSFPAPTPVAEKKIEVRKPIKWVPPSPDLLIDGQPSSSLQENIEVAETRKEALNEIFRDFNVRAEVDNYIIGPSVTRYNIRYDTNVQSKSVSNLLEDISRRLCGVPARFEAVVEGSYFSGIEVPNAKCSIVSFKELFNDLPPVKGHPLAVPFGKNIEGKTIWADFDKFPHILVAGTTGSGKSVFIHSIITTLIMRNSPDNLRIGLIDPKKVEMVKYRDIPHLLCPIIDDPKPACVFLKKLVDEMNDRYSKFASAEGATSLDEYNEYAAENNLEHLPYIVVIVDEYGDLVESNKEISSPILLLGQKARACGIHMLISTQSPTTNIITGPIKNNLPTHVALATANSIQSQTILGVGGAEKLLGHGDMLVQSALVSKVGLARLQGCFAQKKEITYVVGFLKEHYPLQYNEKFLNLEEAAEQEGKAFVTSGGLDGAIDDSEEVKYQSIKEFVMANNFMSMSRIQGECGVGFNRARRFFVRLQNEGVVAKEPDGNKGCPVLMHEDYEESIPTSDELTSF